MLVPELALEKQSRNSHIQQQQKAAPVFRAWLFAFLCEAALGTWFLFIEGGGRSAEQQTPALVSAYVFIYAFK